MAIPPRSRIPPRGDLRHFPPTNGPVLLLAPDRRSIGIYQVPQNTVVFFQPLSARIPPQPPPPTPVPPSPPVSFGNTAQTCVNTCPEGTTGDPISVTIPANTPQFTRSTQEAADEAAMEAACAAAAALREESPCIGPDPGEPGSLWGWGYNFFRNLGTDDNGNKLMPTIVGISAPTLVWTKVDGWGTFSIGLKSDGTLHSWGGNYEGELGLGTRSIFPSVAYDQYKPVQIGTDTDWVDFACGNEWVIARKTDGTVHTWGYNFAGQLAQGDTTRRLSPTPVSGITTCVAVAASEATCHIILADGTLWGAGKAGVGEIGNGVETDALTFRQVGVATDWATVTGGESQSIGTKNDGSVWAWGEWSPIVPPLSPALQIDAGPYESVSMGAGFAIARKSDGTLWALGNNAFGQLGIGSLTDTTVFTQIGGLTTWSKAVCGLFHTVAIKTDGTIWGWGADFNGAIGQASIANDRQVPIQIGPDDLWLDVFAGGGNGGSSFGLRSVTTAPPPPAGISGIAFGGVVSISGGYHIHRLDYSQDFTVVDGAGVFFDILRVGGGAGGGGTGGGGAGQVIKEINITLGNGVYPAVIGSAGFGSAGTARGQSGTGTTFNGQTAVGGGGGGASNDDGTEDGVAGGSGGGAGALGSTATAGTGGNGTAGNDGGDSAASALGPHSAGGGGGGAGSVGSNGAVVPSTSGTGGAGGAGVSDSITGAAVVYGGGGGGGATTTGGAGGSTAGGVGGATAIGGAGRTAGSGGGGGSGNGFSLTGGDGARGVVIVRYLSPP